MMEDTVLILGEAFKFAFRGTDKNECMDIKKRNPETWVILNAKGKTMAEDIQKVFDMHSYGSSMGSPKQRRGCQVQRIHLNKHFKENLQLLASYSR